VNLPEQINSDPNRIKQVLYNLVSNALKFTTKGFIKVFVFTEEKNYDNYKERFINFEVEDTGVGIKRQEIPHLYNLFGINKINKEKKNVGLGLSISSLLTKKLG
jgi:signal transduction histidine kinase